MLARPCDSGSFRGGVAFVGLSTNQRHGLERVAITTAKKHRAFERESSVAQLLDANAIALRRGDLPGW